VFRALTPGAFAFRRALAVGGPLAAAVDAALEVDAASDLAGLVREALNEEVLQCA